MKSLDELLTKILYQNDYAPIPTGFKELDKILGGGLKPFTTTLVAGRPGMGKTSFLLDIAMHHAITTGKKVVYFSDFESAEDIAMRVIGKKTLTRGFGNIMKLKNTETKVILDASYSETKEVPILISDDSKVSASEIKETISMVDNLGMIIVDSNMRFNKGGYEEHSFIHKMTQLSVATNIPVLCSCVVDRSIEQRKNKRPDFDSLGIVGFWGNQQPDIIALYREDYYLDVESVGAASEAIVIPFGVTNIEQYTTARLKWNFLRLRFENNEMIESDACSQYLDRIDNPYYQRWVVFNDYEPCRRDATESKAEQYKNFVHAARDSFEEAKKYFISQMMKFDSDGVLKDIWECLEDREFRQGEITVCDIENIMRYLDIKPDERGNPSQGYAYVETPPNGLETLVFNVFDSTYHFSISRNCFEMENPNDKYFFEVKQEDEGTGELKPYYYMELTPSI